MAQQKFNNAFREALWETYGQKCFHCSRELMFTDMRVDHIVPEHLHHGEPEKREQVLTEIGLPLDFNILSRANLAPTCERCNGQKSGFILVGRSAAVALTRIKNNLPELEHNLCRRRSARDLEKFLRPLPHSLSSGKFTPQQFLEQAVKVLKLYGEETEEFVEVSVTFKDAKTLAMMLERKFHPNSTGLSFDTVFAALDRGDIKVRRLRNGPGQIYVVKGFSLLLDEGDDDLAFEVVGDGIVLFNEYYGDRYHYR